MKKYETLYILDADFDEEARTSHIERFKGIVESSGEIEKLDEWGIRKLAYPLHNKNEGYYVLMNYTATSDVISELARVFGITEGVMRHLTIKQDE